MKPSSTRKAASPSRPVSKYSEVGALASLLQQELANRGTRWPEGALSFVQVRAERKDAGLPSGKSQTRAFLADAVKNGRASMIRGYEPRGARAVPAVRYVFK